MSFLQCPCQKENSCQILLSANSWKWLTFSGNKETVRVKEKIYFFSGLCFASLDILNNTSHVYPSAFAILFGAFSLSFGALDASAKLHADILCGVMHLPMQFFDTNPIGRLVNRFGKDVDTLDSVLPWTLRSWLMCFFTVCSRCVQWVYEHAILALLFIWVVACMWP